MVKRKIILASGSKQRKKLLEMMGIDFEIQKSNYEEDMTEKLPAHLLAEKLAMGKAMDVAKNNKDAIIIDADSFGILDGQFLGKPHTSKKAKNMLQKLSGEKHEFITGIAIIDTKNKKTITDHEITQVYFKEISEKEIDLYVRTKEPLDKAGSYSIQGRGSFFIEKIEGNYSNAVGLPINKLYKHLLSFDVNLLEY
jgi:septum formation protein